MTETLTGTNRSAGISYEELLDEDSHPVRDILRVDSPLEPGPTKVPVERYFSKEFHDLEVEKERLKERLVREVAVLKDAS